MSKRRVSYYYDPDVGSYTYGSGHPMKPQRMKITHELVSAYDMLDKMTILRAKRATAEQMTRFHTDEYVDFLQRIAPELSNDIQYHGSYPMILHEDNPPWEGLFEFCSLSAGGSIDAARRIANGATDVAINWAGGLHHAKKREASGFCYINDIVLGILELLRVFPRVLYIDIDCHHGDGVEEAFYTTNRVMTCSFHKYGEYFPGTGTQEDKGRGEGRGYALNVPMKDGLSDEGMKSVFEPVISRVIETFQPSAIVLQCGADSVAGDKLGCFNVSMLGHANCVKFVRTFNIPFMMVGGGGYTVKNVARTWTYETACALGIENEIDPILPWNPYFEWFGPRYRLEVLPTNVDDLNLKHGSLNKVREKALEQLDGLQPAPSAAMQNIPSETLGEHLGFSSHQMKGHDRLDEELAQHARFVYDLDESPSSSSVDSSEYDSEASEYSRSRSRNINKISRSKRAPQKLPHINSHSAMTRGKKRMSIMTNQWVDALAYEFGLGLGLAMPSNTLPNGGDTEKKPTRRFFESAAKWDKKSGTIHVQHDGIDHRVARLTVDNAAVLEWSRYYDEDDDDVIEEDIEGEDGSVGDDERDGEMDIDEDDT